MLAFNWNHGAELLQLHAFIGKGDYVALLLNRCYLLDQLYFNFLEIDENTITNMIASCAIACLYLEFYLHNSCMH